jgi:hypothetical protein
MAYTREAPSLEKIVWSQQPRTKLLIHNNTSLLIGIPLRRKGTLFAHDGEFSHTCKAHGGQTVRMFVCLHIPIVSFLNGTHPCCRHAPSRLALHRSVSHLAWAHNPIDSRSVLSIVFMFRFRVTLGCHRNDVICRLADKSIIFHNKSGWQQWVVTKMT